MQLKRLRKTGAIASQQADDSQTAQDVSESQLLRELEDLTGGFAADDSGFAKVLSAPPLSAPATAAVAGSNSTPAIGTKSRKHRSSGLNSSGRRQRREFKSLFGSQGDEQQQPHPGGDLCSTAVDGQQRQEDLDLDTLPWMQPQKTPPTATAAGNAAGDSGVNVSRAAAAAAAASSDPAHLNGDQGWLMRRVTNHTASQQQQQQQQQHCMQHHSSYLGEQEQQDQQEQQQQQQQQQQSYQYAHSPQIFDEGEEDPISADSDTDVAGAGGWQTAPGLAAEGAAAAARGVLCSASKVPAILLTSPRSNVKQQHQQQQQQQQQHMPGATAHTPPPPMSGLRHQGQQQQQQQQRRASGMCDLSRLLQPTPSARAAAAAAAGAAPGMGMSPVHVAAHLGMAMLGYDDGDVWQPPKYKRQQQTQQQQLPASTARPPAGRRLQPAGDAVCVGAAGTPAAGECSVGSRFGRAAAAAAAAVGGGCSVSGTSPMCATYAAVMGFGGSHVAGPGAAGAAAFVEDVGEQRPWWTVLDDFVPVEVLVQSLLNPRDNTLVHIHYKSQFKEGPATARHANTGTPAGSRSAAPSSKKKSTAGARGKRGAAAAAAAGAGGFMTAGALAASQPAARKGRRVSRKSGSGRGSGGGSSGGTKKRKGRSRRQGWRTIAGQKVFVDASGKQLSGGAAYKAYKGGDF